MTGFASFGCDPEQVSDDLDDFRGLTLGTIAYSPSGGMYQLIQANGAIAAGELCYIEHTAFEINEAPASLHPGAALCIPQVALDDEDYGWALVVGAGQVQVTGAAVVATARYGAAIGATGQVMDAAGTDAISGLILTTAAGGAAGRLVDCYARFPVKVS